MATVSAARQSVNTDLYAVLSAHGLVLDWFHDMESALRALATWEQAALVTFDGIVIARKEN